MSSLAIQPAAVAAPSVAPWEAPRGLVVFDLDHTLLPSAALARARTVRHALGAAQSGDRIRLAAARVKAARSLRGAPRAAITAELEAIRLTPEAEPTIARLTRHGIACALVSLGWDFVLESLAARLGIEHYLGTGLEPSGAVVHVWSEDRLDFTRRLGEQLRLPAERTLLVSQRQPLPALADQLIRRWS